MDIEKLLVQYKYIESGFMNQYRMKPNELKFNDVDVKTFNSILDILEKSDLNTITRTKSGAIKLGKDKFNNAYSWDLITAHTGLRITIIIGCKQWVFKIGAIGPSNHPPIYPNVAFAKFKSKCLDKGINLDDYKITNGKEIKEEIEEPLIQMKYHLEKDQAPLNHVNHIDFHSSYPAGLANTHPEFRPMLEELYNERNDPKLRDLNKAILNDSIGWMQSYKPEQNRYAEWAHLSRDAIKDNNKRLIELTIRLEASGREVIGYNTDGIWYRGDVYHGAGEGDKLGQWHNDYTKCIFRSKTDGAYEFIDDNGYHAVVRGLTSYDMVEPDRTKWKFGDIYKGSNINYKFNRELRRIVKYEKEL